MMDLRETLSVAIDALRGNKLRAILTSLGVIIGSASIVLVVTVALTSRKFVLGQIEATGSNLVWAELVRAGAKGQPLSYELTVDDMNAVKAAIPGVVEVAGARELPMTVIVIGVFRERVATFGLSDIQRDTVIIPFTLMKYYTGVEVLRTLDAQATRPEDVPGVQRRMERLLRSRHPAEAEYDVQTLAAILSAAKNISLALTIVLLVVAFIAL